jgi:hypothetical protein
MTSSKLVRDYYTVIVPGDLCDDPEGMADAAIYEARERARLYCVPAEWSATLIGQCAEYDVYRVCRRRRKEVKP